MKVLYIIGSSQYQSTIHFMREMAEEMERCGYEVYILDGNDKENFEAKWEEVKDREYDVIFTINGMILEEDSALGAYLLQERNPLYCTYLMDHPMIHKERLQNVYPHTLVLSPDRKHVEYTDRYMKHIWCAGFLPHGGCQATVCKPYQDRKLDISFMGSYAVPDIIWGKFDNYPEKMATLMRDTAGLLTKETQLTIEDAMQQIFAQKGVGIAEADFPDIVAEFRDVDRYIRSYYRDLVIRTLVEAGITVDVYGDGWENFVTSGKEYLKVHPSLSYQESLEIIGDSKISLNVMPWFKDGAHDRVFTAMLNGAICLTDGSEYLQEIGKEEENIYFYSLKGLRYLPAKVKRILADDEKAEAVALAGMELARQYHTWKNRAIEVMDYWEQLQEMRQGDGKEHAEQTEEISGSMAKQDGLDALVVQNACLLRLVDQTVCYFRRQEYLYGLRKVTEIIDKISQLLPEYIKFQDYFNEEEVLIHLEGISSMLTDLLAAQEQSDYIWLADLMELCLRPFIIHLQEYYGRTKQAPDTGINGYRLEYTSCGLLTLAVERAGKNYYLHSNGDIWKEAQELAGSWFENGSFHYTVYGMGLGYAIEALLAIDEAITVTVLEADANILALARQCGRRELWENERLTILHDPDFTHLLSVAKEPEKGGIFVVHYPSMQLIDNAHYKKQLEDYFIQYSSAKTQQTRLMGNFVRNKVGFCHEISEIKDKFEGNDLYIIAAGPSLDKNMMELKKVMGDGRSIILSTGTVLKKLLKAGIRPDYVIIIDGGSFTYGQIQGIEDCQIPLLYMATAYYKIPASYQGEKYVIFQKDYTESEHYVEEKGGMLFETGGSVSTTALDIGIRFDCRRIVFVGLDLAYTGDKDHASDTAAAREIRAEDGIVVEDVDGGLVKTAKNLDLYRRWIEERISKESHISFIDATEGGARIKGTQLRKLSELTGNAKDLQQGADNIAKSASVSDSGGSVRERNRIVLLWKESKYDIQKYMADALEKCFLARGYRVAKISLSEKNPYSNFDRVLGEDKKDICLFFSIDAVGFEMQALNDTRWVNNASCLCVTYLCHAPLHYYEQLSGEFGWNILVHSPHEAYLQEIKKYFPALEDTLLLDAIGFEGKNIQPFGDRKYEVYLPVDYTPASVCMEQIHAMPEVFKSMADEMIQRLQRTEGLSLEKALESCLEQMQFRCSLEEFYSLMQMMEVAALYVRMERIEKIAASILEQGIMLAVSGSGWGNFHCKDADRLLLLDGKEDVDFAKMLDYMGDAKIVLDVPGNGGTDTAILHSAIKNGAVCLTDAAYQIENFQAGEEILYYTSQDMDRCGQMVQNYLDKTQMLEQISSKGRKKAQEGMDIEQYAEMLLHLEDV